MKRLFLSMLAIVVLLCGCLQKGAASPGKSAAVSAQALQQTGEAAVGAELSTTINSPYEIIFSWPMVDTLPLHIDGSWSYFGAQIKSEQGVSSALMRENPQGENELLLNIPREAALLTYVEESLVQSGNSRLYFTASTEPAGQNELYCFSLADKKPSLILPAPCSNMVVPTDPTPALTGFGWVAYEDILVGIELATGKAYKGAALNDTPAVSDKLLGHFFYGIGAESDTKYTTLEPLGGDLLLVKTVEYNSQTSSAEKITEYYYDTFACSLTTDEPQSAGQTLSGAVNNQADGTCAAGGCTASAKYGRYCVDHVCMSIGCFDRRYQGSRYCAKHTDSVADAPEYACAFPGCTTRAKYGDYCSEHACKAGTCTNPRLPDGKYCEMHAVSQLCKVSGCYNSAEVGGGYCKEHSEMND